MNAGKVALLGPVEIKTPFALSFSTVKLFIDCARCFYLDRRLGISRPAGFPFNLNSAVDALPKTKFDSYRKSNEPCPMMTEAGLRAAPHANPRLDSCRSNFRSVHAVHAVSNLEVYEAIDDLWRDPGTDEFMMVDYKSTSKNPDVGIDFVRERPVNSDGQRFTGEAYRVRSRSSDR
jgi:hypothetical protein